MRHQPNVRMLAQWLGLASHACWEQLVRFVEAGYPDQFTIGWDYSTSRRTWELWIRGRTTLCRLSPGMGAFTLRLLLTEQEAERAQLEPGLTATGRAAVKEGVRRDQRRCTVSLIVFDESGLADAKLFLAAKRPPKAVAI